MIRKIQDLYKEDASLYCATDATLVKITVKIDHLFLHCVVAKGIWDMFSTLFGISWLCQDL